MKLAIATAIVFAAGIYPGLAGYDGRPPPNPPPRVKAHKPAPPKPPATIAGVLEKLKQKLEHRAEAGVSTTSRDG
jgi:hypothetical protein